MNIEQVKKEYFDRHIKNFSKWTDENYNYRDKFAAEITYKFSNLIITLNTGILAAMSFLLKDGNELTSISKLLTLVLILPILSILLEIRFKEKAVMINRDACNQRIAFLKTLPETKIFPIIEKRHTKIEEWEKDVLEMQKHTNEGFEKVMRWINQQGDKIEWLRVWSKVFLISTLIGLIIIIFIETGTAEFILELFKKMVTYIY